MKKIVLSFLFIVFFVSIFSAPFKFLPHKITQPNGEVINCFVSGDEFFNWIHDKDGYSIIQAPDGYYYYATKKEEKIIASSYKVNSINPKESELKKWVRISNAEYKKRVESFKVPALKSAGPTNAPHTGTMNNIAIYIRFSGDDEIATIRNDYDDKLNMSSGNSLKAYYQEVSYNNLTISSTHYPVCDDPSTTNTSYEDSHERAYFQPYNETTNTIGYDDDTERRNREHQLLVDAINWINANAPIDAGLDIDADGDDRVDNVSFMIKGDSDGWAELLWAHRWSLFSQTIEINGKRVYDYTFQPENQVSVRTLCHEMFHALGAPDLYHYDEDYDHISPVGHWDLMQSGGGHMGAYMKWRYADAKWVTSIPEITSSGTYTLNPLTSSTNNCFKIASPNSASEFFVVEYRKQSGTFESQIPGDGLIVYRINSDFNGNAGFDNTSSFDEVYIYRPDGTTTVNGSVNNAYFSLESGRTAIDDTTNPSSFLHDDSPGILSISNITSAAATISFDVYISEVESPQNFTATASSTSQIDLGWDLNTLNQNVLLVWSEDGTFGSPVSGTSYSAGEQLTGGGTILYAGNNTTFSHSGLDHSTFYYYKIWSVSSLNEYSSSLVEHEATFCEEQVLPVEEGFNGINISACWTVELIEQGGVEDEDASITQVQSGRYPDATPDEGSHMIKFNSAYCGDGNIMRLSSPTFSTIGQSGVVVSFSWHKDDTWPDYLDFMTLQWSADGTTWTDGDSYQRYNARTLWTNESYTLPVEAEERENLQVAFKFTSKYGYNCYMDNLKIEMPNTTLVENIEQSQLIVFPNPSNGLFQIKMIDPFENISIQVRDINGKLVYTEQQENKSIYTIDLSNQAKGVYLLEVNIEQKVITQKLIVR
ncbi:MAG: hypothetical protein DRJ10_03685 [Bacteroidetes bacterium]|nr:MAG: hypothetical protein DRJ10_03685 [Bacteroidota bacterium]